jgi:hypothetical protein
MVPKIKRFREWLLAVMEEDERPNTADNDTGPPAMMES